MSRPVARSRHSHVAFLGKPSAPIANGRRSQLRHGPFGDPGAGGDILADLNPGSLEVLRDCRIEPALAEATTGAAVQFERQGYFCLDVDSRPDRPVFNRTIGLRDTWAKVQASAGKVDP